MNIYLQALLGFILSLTLILVLMPFYIKVLKNRNINQVASEYALDEYKQKNKTPIMGGLLFVIIPVFVYLIVCFNKLSDKRILFVILSYVLFSMVGFIDDMLIIVKKDNEGLSPLTRIIMEFVIGLFLFVTFKDIIPTHISIPLTNICVDINPIIFMLFMILLYMTEANAVNFTDGMDGLCAGVSFIGLIPFLVFCLIYKDSYIAILIICILGGLLAYLYFNWHPAKIFMGDSGSLALGALFASVGILLNKTIPLFIIGGVFVIEMFCVVVQQLSVRLFKKRVFSYTPIHYAFSIKGYKETRIVIGFYLVGILLAIIGLFIGL